MIDTWMENAGPKGADIFSFSFSNFVPDSNINNIDVFYRIAKENIISVQNAYAVL